MTPPLSILFKLNSSGSASCSHCVSSTRRNNAKATVDDRRDGAQFNIRLLSRAFYDLIWRAKTRQTQINWICKGEMVYKTPFIYHIQSMSCSQWIDFIHCLAAAKYIFLASQKCFGTTNFCCCLNSLSN